MDPTLPCDTFLPAPRADEAEVRRQSAVLQAAPLVGALLDATMGFSAVLNLDRQIVLANRALREFAQSRAGGWAGLRPGEALCCVNVDGAPGGCGTAEGCRYCGAAQALSQALRGAPGLQECRIQVGGAGDDLDLLVRTTPLTLEREPFLIFAAMDISHEKRHRALERIFFHDVTNTAGGIKGLATLMLKAAPELVAKKYAPLVEAASVALLDEIASQRDLTAAESGELRVRPSPLSARALLDEVAQVCGHHTVGRDRSVVLHGACEDPELVTDRALLTRVLVNLLKNALEAEPPGGRVTATCRCLGDRVRFEVHNPTAMPREVQLQLFQRSYSTKGQGRGLGTYSIRLLTERYLGGKVGFASSPEEGTRFFAEYPRVLEAAGPESRA